MLISLNIFMFILILCTILFTMFFLSSKKSSWDKYSSSSFECGYSSYFFSRFSFSIHYFMVALIFLFLDLELCFLIPSMISVQSSLSVAVSLSLFLFILLLGLMIEWTENRLDWVF